MKHDFTSHDLHLPELTMRGMLLGVLITVIFTASNVYLGLKVGLTFSSSIPAAIISMAILRLFKDSNVLENNMVQTQASAAGTLSAVIFVLPGLLMLGYWQGFPFWQTFMLCACGGCLGVLFTIPLRRAMVVNSDLPYPEGRAAAEILKVGSHSDEVDGKSSSGMRDIVNGGLIAGFISLCANGFRVLAAETSFWFAVGKGTTQFPMGFSMALLGAGYLIGIASGIAILIGMIIAWGGFVPYLTNILPMDGDSATKFAMSVWKSKVRFIGAGTIGIAAIWTLLTLTKPIVEGMRISVKNMNMSAEDRDTHRMDTDMTPKTVLGVFIAIILGLVVCFYSFVSAVPISAGLMWTLVVVGIIIALLIGFFVAAACGYMAGLIGTSASPISGIGILGIIISSLVVYGIATANDLFATQAGVQFATAMALFMTSVVVCIAAISNDNLQDLKTGQLVGATPWRQQVALLIGSVVGAVAIAPVLNLLYQAYGFTGAMPRAEMDAAQALSAPQATLMTTIAQGIFSSSLDWTYILIGVGVGIVAIIVNLILKSTTATLSLPPLAIGMGIYLPPTLEMPLVMGSVISYFVGRYLVQQARQRSGELADLDVEQSNRRGVLFASGLIVGESLIGVIIAVIIVLSVTSGGSEAPLSLVGPEFESTAEWLGLAAFVAVAIYMIRLVVTHKFDKAEALAMKEEQEK
ncbi:oligopeptide transporter, OPT family [Veillonella sp. YH-vei2232]|jgi:putative OPT family oligopeptide transporter|uniref:Oligopeptide transporter, OPT family n=1 Tax=Veillonella absiana TaxID=3079305 RepID=A0ABU3Z877_9FIRM|nr:MULTISPECIES: oligopeptide transporter, OPT family [unclassified Veillonella]MBK7920963.1 oligopeptide transporter, OPT family [Veillonella sp.]MBP6922766.1 oligopeptide transporter, OPT family [Veillonella sp.]MBP8617304.1 oligopeptide transporter, OPT family [Veillonella sp.]MBP9516729.1 oligopeptide transporter, OPT family [Veillonella sp.]MBP9550510.1 oligopeptide transporter, OPT family [Veillonella sp.]